MNFKTTLELLLLLLDNLLESPPDGGIVVPSTGEWVPFVDLRRDVQTMRDYVWPESKAAELQKVVLCTDCKYCKRQRKKGPEGVAATRLICDLTGEPTTRMFYCGKGEARE